MSDFKTKMHQIQFRLWLCLRPRWGGGAYSAPPDLIAGFKGPTSKGMEGKGEGICRGPENSMFRGPRWLSAGLLYPTVGTVLIHSVKPELTE